MRAKTAVAALLVGGLVLGSAHASAQTFPASLKGKIITSNSEIQVPSTPKDFVAKLKKQDKSTFKKGDGGYVIHFVAFFNKAVPVDSIGIVVLDDKNEAIAVADVPEQKGNWSLSSQITVDETESPGKKHILQVFYATGKNPVVLAKKEIVLK